VSQSENDRHAARPAAAIATQGEFGARRVVAEIERAIGHLQGELSRRERDEALRERAARERRTALAALGARIDEAGRLAGDLDGLIDAGGEERARLIIARLRAVVAGVACDLPALVDDADDGLTGGAGPLGPAIDPPEMLRRPEFFDPEVIVVPPPASPRALGIVDRSEVVRRAAATMPDRLPDPWRYVRPPARPAPAAAQQPPPAAALETPPPEQPHRPLTWRASRPINRLVRRFARSGGSVADEPR
jgi:hypothetical protein